MYGYNARPPMAIPIYTVLPLLCDMQGIHPHISLEGVTCTYMWLLTSLLERFLISGGVIELVLSTLQCNYPLTLHPHAMPVREAPSG